MSEFCSACFEDCTHMGYDIDLYGAAKKLKKGYMMSFLCEGCNRRAIARDDEGNYEIVFKRIHQP